MSGKLGLAILGSGIFVTEAHLPAVLGASNISLEALWSRSQKSVEVLASSDALKSSSARPKTYFGDDGLNEVLARDDIKAVIMALPISKQPEIILKCFRAGKHVLSEKPIAKDVATAKDLIKTYETEYKPKGIMWRVAENFAHEPAILAAAEILKNPALGPVLYYNVSVVNNVALGIKYHATEWRAVPDYQGGFLLDGGVHFAAAIRVCLADKRPTQLIAHAGLHRTHLGPHDTIQALASAPAISSPPHGEEFPLPKNAPQGIGASSPTGTITFSFAAPRTPEPSPPTWTFTCLNGVVVLKGGKSWSVEVLSSDDKVKSIIPGGTRSFPSRGVPEEVEQFAAACGDKSEVNRAEPRDALWDLAFIESCLTSNGKPVDLEKLAA